ncbi:hypothetical protein WOSG25_120190 [Weissella oryzae SG25]|uniref:Uncharacterized protein n=1 Tax=Weissella oryzae (strain DSM 25784 / JCM 18191 / LMG 30913 / SG25) TaxID=1329250 RepID=A0A069CWM2_WEIOS|nr:hypothetical protein [Weissella oryzae]GAK31628.1 hypothetical protein WOSG25_120190 [Weissella oryzae SG25]
MRSEKNQQRKHKRLIIWLSILAIGLVIIVSAVLLNQHQTAEKSREAASAKRSSQRASEKQVSERSKAKSESSARASSKKAEQQVKASSSKSSATSNNSAFEKLGQRSQLAILTQWAWGGNADPAATFAVAEGQSGGVIYIRTTHGAGTASLGGWINDTRKIIDNGDETFTIYTPQYNGTLDGSPIPLSAVTWVMGGTISAEQLLANYQTSGAQLTNSMDLSQLSTADPTLLK